jgi:hypothetical protein
MKKRNSAARGMRRIGAVAIITLLAYPGADAHPFSWTMEAHNLANPGPLFGQKEFGGRDANDTYRGIESAVLVAVKLFVMHQKTGPEASLENYQQSGARMHYDGSPESKNYAELVSFALYMFLLKEQYSASTQQRITDTYNRRDWDQMLCVAREHDAPEEVMQPDGVDMEIQHDAEKDIRAYYRGLNLQGYIDKAYEVASSCRKMRQDVDDQMWDWVQADEGRQARDWPEEYARRGQIWPADLDVIGKLDRSMVRGEAMAEQWRVGLAPLVGHPGTRHALFHGMNLRTSSGPASFGMVANGLRSLLAGLEAPNVERHDVTTQVTTIELGIRSVRDQLRTEMAARQEEMNRLVGEASGNRATQKRIDGLKTELQVIPSAIRHAQNAVDNADPVSTYLIVRYGVHRELEEMLGVSYNGSGEDAPDYRIGTRGPDASYQPGDSVAMKVDADDGYGELGNATITLSQMNDEWTNFPDSEQNDRDWVGDGAADDDTEVRLDLGNQCATEILGPSKRAKNHEMIAMWCPEIRSGQSTTESLKQTVLTKGGPFERYAITKSQRYLSLPTEPALVVKYRNRSGKPDKRETVAIDPTLYRNSAGVWSNVAAPGDTGWKLWMTMRYNTETKRHEIRAVEEEPVYPLLGGKTQKTEQSTSGTVLAIYRTRRVQGAG